jgi:hypothetical protein
MGHTLFAFLMQHIRGDFPSSVGGILASSLQGRTTAFTKTQLSDIFGRVFKRSMSSFCMTILCPVPKGNGSNAGSHDPNGHFTSIGDENIMNHDSITVRTSSGATISPSWAQISFITPLFGVSDVGQGTVTISHNLLADRYRKHAISLRKG